MLLAWSLVVWSFGLLVFWVPGKQMIFPDIGRRVIVFALSPNLLASLKGLRQSRSCLLAEMRQMTNDLKFIITPAAFLFDQTLARFDYVLCLDPVF